MTINRRDLLVSGSAATALATGSLVASDGAKAQAAQPAVEWDYDADVVVIGSGATGLPAAIVAREAGSSVIVVEAQEHTGGHAICSGGNIPLGGGDRFFRRNGVFRIRPIWSSRI